MLIGPGLADNRIEKRTTEKANIVPGGSGNQPRRGLGQRRVIPYPCGGTPQGGKNPDLTWIKSDLE
jgi:hypothetical protein